MEKNKKKTDYQKLFKLLLKHKKTYYKVFGVTLVLACVYSFSIPKTYFCRVLLAPELSSTRSSTSLSAIARSFGMKLGSNMLGNSSEALFPTLYPDMMNSVDFMTSLFDIQVCAKDSIRPKSYYDYLLYDQKRPWWSAAIGGTIGAITRLLPSDADEGEAVLPENDGNTGGGKKKVNPFRLTKKQTLIADVIAHKVMCDVDQKTLVITIDVVDQDPLICATVADSVKERLQDFITLYRTNKARVDLEYNQKLCREAKARYDKSRQLYADFADANQDVVLQSVRTKLTDLENEMQLQFNAYQMVVSQLQTAEAQVQQETPAFMTLQSATVPIKPVAPQKKKIFLFFFFIAFVGTSAWVLHKENELKPLLGIQGN